MDALLRKLHRDFPDFLFVKGAAACWSPKGKQIFYTSESPAGLLHEVAHAHLGHHTYHSDMDLVHKELAAWEEAANLARSYAVALDQEYVQDCLDTYRDWLHKRSTCPTCLSIGLQADSRHYNCLNCGQQWQVTDARFCRPYRRSVTSKMTANQKDQS